MQIIGSIKCKMEYFYENIKEILAPFKNAQKIIQGVSFTE